MNSHVFAVLSLFVVAAVADHNCAVQSRVCQNGGICHDNAATQAYLTPKCLCPAGFGGDDCSFVIRECKENPCMNGGSCQPSAACSATQYGWDCFKCTCLPGWAGAPSAGWPGTNKGGMCESWVGDPCGGETYCKNGATCVYGTKPNTDGKWTCQCVTGYYGQNCTLTCDTTKGNTAPCQNSATCAASGKCTCGANNLGPTCAYAKVCSSANPCKNTAACHEQEDATTANPNQVSQWCGDGTSPPVSSGLPSNCPPNYRGVNCEADGYCKVNPCQNGGTCSEPVVTGGTASALAAITDGTCACTAGFAGARCEKAIAGCYTYNLRSTGPPVATANPKCSNGGTCNCVDASSCGPATISGSPWATVCDCTAGFGDCRCNTTYSALCTNFNADNHVCKNGGTCGESQDSYGCNCGAGFWGKRCENYDNPCLNMPCQNGGRCKVITQTRGNPLDDRYWSWQCECKYPYYGERCERKVADLLGVCYTLAENPCKNGGTCMPNNYRTGYGLGVGGGGFWHVKDDDSTVDNDDDYRVEDEAYMCQCATGFYGATCEATTDPSKVVCPAENPCSNGGTCFVKPGKKYYQCGCPCGYSGHRCQIEASNRLFNGVVGIGGRMRFCSNGVSCQNGGTCFDDKNGQSFGCTCPTSYYGWYCELKGKSAAAGVAPSLLVVAVAAIAAALKL